MPKHKEISPPNSIVELVAIALGDMERLVSSGKYTVYMNDWHRPKSDVNPCAVCFAGAVMAGTLGAVDTKYHIPSDFGTEWYKALTILDLIRRGVARVGPYVPAHYVYYHLRERLGEINNDLSDYTSDFDVHFPEFSLHVRAFAAELEALGHTVEDLRE